MKKIYSILLSLALMFTFAVPVSAHCDEHESCSCSHKYGWVHTCNDSGCVTKSKYKCSKCNKCKETATSTSCSKSCKKNHTYSCTYKCTTHDKVKSCTVTKGKSHIKITKHTNTKVTYKCKSKGKATIKVKMKSGVCHTFKITVK